jgi:hypothetical protein
MPPAARLLALFMVMSICAWTIIARVHLLPWLDQRPKERALMILVTPQMFRTIGAMALFPGIGDPPSEWATPLAWGDCTTAVLSMLAILALHHEWKHATKLVWLSAVFGLVDMLHNAVNSIALQVAPRLGPIGYVVGFGVPMMLVFHMLVFRALLRPAPN